MSLWNFTMEDSLLGSLVRLSLPWLPYQESSCSIGPTVTRLQLAMKYASEGLWPTPHNWLRPISSDPSNTRPPIQDKTPSPTQGTAGILHVGGPQREIISKKLHDGLRIHKNWEVVGWMVLYPTLDVAWIRTKNCVVENGGKAIALWIMYIYDIHFLILNDNGHFEVKMGEILQLVPPIFLSATNGHTDLNGCSPANFASGWRETRNGTCPLWDIWNSLNCLVLMSHGFYHQTLHFLLYIRVWNRQTWYNNLQQKN